MLPPGSSRGDDPSLPMKLGADDSGGQLSVFEFTMGGWEAGPPLHLHSAVDEAFYVISGALELVVGDERLLAPAGAFVWAPRGIRHTFANGSDEPAHALMFAVPGGIEAMFAEQGRHMANGAPDPTVMDEIGRRHGAATLGPPIRARNAPAG